MNDGTLQTVCEIAGGVFGVPVSQIDANSSPETIAAWDSTKQIYLVLALEEEFGVALDPGDFEGVTTIGDFARVVDAKR
jgi:acyl carrier protein